MNTNAGYTLIEILITLGILSIISGIAYVSYQGYNVNASQKDLKLHGELFSSAVKKCITVSGKWIIKGLDDDGNPVGRDYYPCNPEGTDQETIRNELKKKLHFTCPKDAECKISTSDVNKYTCLSIEKEVSGKKLQVISRVSFENPSNYEIWCNEVADYLKFEFGGRRCRKGENQFMKHPPGDSDPTSELKQGCPDW